MDAKQSIATIFKNIFEDVEPAVDEDSVTVAFSEGMFSAIITIVVPETLEHEDTHMVEINIWPCTPDTERIQLKHSSFDQALRLCDRLQNDAIWSTVRAIEEEFSGIFIVLMRSVEMYEDDFDVSDQAEGAMNPFVRALIAMIVEGERINPFILAAAENGVVTPEFDTLLTTEAVSEAVN